MDNASEYKKVKKRKKSASNEENISNAVSLFFEKNASTIKVTHELMFHLARLMLNAV